MAGMGIFPDPAGAAPAHPQDARYNLAEIDNLLERSATNYLAPRQCP